MQTQHIAVLILFKYAERFYAEPHKYALKLQLWILNQRYLTYVAAVKHVLDTGVYVGGISIYMFSLNIMLHYQPTHR